MFFFKCSIEYKSCIDPSRNIICVRRIAPIVRLALSEEAPHCRPARWFRSVLRGVLLLGPSRGSLAAEGPCGGVQRRRCDKSFGGHA